MAKQVTKLSLQTAEDLADLYRALSDPTRLRIISALMAGELRVGELVESIGLSKSAISHQLRGLKDRHIIRTHKQGRNVFLELDDEHIKELFQRGLEHVRHK